MMDQSHEVSQYAMTVSQPAQYQCPGTDTAKCNTVLINIIYSCASNICHKKAS